MAITLGEAADNFGPPRRGLWTTAVGAAPDGSLMLASAGLGTIKPGRQRGGGPMTIRYPVAPPTLADVAERAGVSRQTVSNAINNPDLLRADTLTRVQEAIEELGYSPNRAARNLRTRTSSLIGLRFTPAQEGTANAMMDRFVHSLVETAGGAGYHILLFAVGEEEDDLSGYDDLLRSTAVDAFIVTDTYLGNPQAVWLRQRRATAAAPRLAGAEG